MKKFLKNKSWGFRTPSKSFENGVPLSLETKEFSENDVLREKVFLLEQEAQKLRDVTRKLLTENGDLKDKLEILLIERAEGPSSEEFRKVIEKLTAENDFLSSTRNQQQLHMLEMKAIHVEQINKLNEQLDEYKLENCDLNQKLNELTLECSRLNMQVKMVLEEGEGGEVPLKVHESILRQCQESLTSLKIAHHEQLTRLKNHCDLTDAQVRILSLKVAELKAELDTTRTKP